MVEMRSVSSRRSSNGDCIPAVVNADNMAGWSHVISEADRYRAWATTDVEDSHPDADTGKHKTGCFGCGAPSMRSNNDRMVAVSVTLLNGAHSRTVHRR